MPTYKVVLFSDSIHQQYMNEQQRAINDALPDVTTEVANHEDSRLALYAKHPTRVPCVIVFKDDARMLVKHAKRQHSEIIDWIKSAIGS